jgi:hypothetical protein
MAFLGLSAAQMTYHRPVLAKLPKLIAKNWELIKLNNGRHRWCSRKIPGHTEVW